RPPFRMGGLDPPFHFVVVDLDPLSQNGKAGLSDEPTPSGARRLAFPPESPWRPIKFLRCEPRHITAWARLLFLRLRPGPAPDQELFLLSRPDCIQSGREPFAQRWHCADIGKAMFGHDKALTKTPPCD